MRGLNRPHTEEEKRKIGLGNKGKIISQEQREQLRIARAKQKDPRIGTKHSAESKLKMSIAKRGNKSPTWKGGISPFKTLVRALFEYRQWRFYCFTRDSFMCQWCGSKKDIQVDHYPKGFSEIIDEYKISTLEEAKNCPELWNIDNGRTLCKECHKTTENYAGRGIKK